MEYSLGGKWLGTWTLGVVEAFAELLAEALDVKDVPWPSGVACSNIGLSIAAIGEDIT